MCEIGRKERDDQARQHQLREQSRSGAVPLRPLPRWEKLTPEIREAMIRIFYVGRMDALREEDNSRTNS